MNGAQEENLTLYFHNFKY